MKKPILSRSLILFSLMLWGFAAQANFYAKDTTVHVVADKMPMFPGGVAARTQFLSTHLTYPEEALKSGVSGKVYVTFVVERDGRITHISVLKGIGHGCDQEAMKVVSEMPRWEPGFIKKRKVRVRVTLPFLFNIQPKDKVYFRADRYPVFDCPGGLRVYLNRNIRYPVGMIKNKVIDTVKVFYTVEPDRRITQVKVNKDSTKLNAYDYEAIRLVKNIKVAEPAYIKQIPVALRLYIPVVFNYKEIDTTTTIKMDTAVNGKTISYYQQGQIFVVVDHMPSFPGGAEALMKYLAQSIRYPQEAKSLHQQGRIFINFVVEGDGTITNISVLRGVSPSLDAEAVRVIKNLPKWIPGTQRGKPVRVSFNLPIKFSLK